MHNDAPCQSWAFETAHSYDLIAAEFAERWFDCPPNEALRRFAGRLMAGMRVLDVGCGPGRDLLWLSEQGFQVVGIDLSMGMLQEGRARLRAWENDAPLVQADMAHLPFGKSSFDGVWVCASLLHIPKMQVGDVLRELGRVVYPGYVYLSVKRGEGEEWVVDEAGRRRFFVYYQPAELELMLERFGFQVLEAWESQDSLGRRHRWLNVLARAVKKLEC